MSKKILILTALSLEFTAVKAHLNDLKREVHPTTNSEYGRANYNGFDILIGETGAGNTRSADETGRAIAYFKPDYVFFVGVAGGIKDVKLGDVVASTKVIGFEMGKDDIEFKGRPDTIPSSYALEQLAKHISREAKWIELNVLGIEQSPASFVGPIAAGEKVLASNRSIAYQYLRENFSDALAVDMEGNGFLVAARPYKAEAIEIRGISDLIEGKEEADASGSQPIAAANASAFCFAMINSMKTEDITADISTIEGRKQLVNILVQLYPQGPEDNDIWKRSGGDVSLLINSNNRRSQWYGLIEKLAQGGGGNITLYKLLVEVKADFPDFKF